ncbi:MAG: ABC transporter permease [Actinobacteria bacterium]|nr:ABC transporter permease [Actinomycetota bacterium]
MRIPRPRPLAVIATLLFIFLYVPIVVVVLYAFNSGSNLSWPLQGFSLHWFEVIFTDETFSEALEESARVAVISTVIAAIAAGLAAVVFTRQRWFLPRLVEGVSRLPIMIPPILIGVAMLTAIGLAKLRLSMWTVVAGHLIYIIPYVLVVIVARLNNFDVQLEQAARDLGAGPVRSLWFVTLPIVAPAVLGAALLAIGLSFDEVFITNFTVGTDPTLPIYVLSKLRRVVDPSVNAVATVLLVIPWIALGLSALIMGRSFRGRRKTNIGGEIEEVGKG